VIDELGRWHELPGPAYVNLDSTPPDEEGIAVYGRETTEIFGVNLRELLAGMSLGWFFDDSLELTIQAEEAAAISGLAEIRYYLSEDEEAETIGANDALWATAPVYSESNKPLLDKENPHRGVIYVRAEDKAGNTTVAATKLVVVDAEPPMAPTVTAKTESGAAYAAGDWVNENVVFTVYIPGELQPKARVKQYEYSTKLSQPEEPEMWGEWLAAENGSLTVAAGRGRR
jgi:hypothetical protein